MKPKSKKRFITIYEEGMIDGNSIIVDRVTRIQYYFHYNGNASGLTPLLAEDGTPLLYMNSFESEEEEEW